MGISRDVEFREAVRCGASERSGFLSWRLLYGDGAEGKPVAGASEFGTKMDQFSRVTSAPVTVAELRIEVQLQPNWPGGVLEWKVY